ncbi:hypothetical protein PLICRDRAFT_57993 [Plicaturopsis crispa FD-325 SS-3]|uniref:Prolyl endopeptidase n=1 Tax=Plicaturopsis crispa FD-325 SS-3 TaxID=944288 RepID=A0A0C9SQY3_PLICR|nr:hypothetical protein PLICRDRAFT_57993 [Plicaturopsis crispa FD-325 SS-3]
MAHRLYQELAEIPTPASASFLSRNAIRLDLSIRDHVRNVKRSITKTIHVASEDNLISASSEAGDIVRSTVSPSGKRTANLRETADPNVPGSRKRYVEIWLGDRLQVCHDVTKAHGAFYVDDTIGSLAFNDSETALLYSAEANAPRGDSDNDPYARFRYTPQLGEGLQGKKRPTTYLMKWDAASNSTPSDIAATTTPWYAASTSSTTTLLGQAVFAGDNRAFATEYLYTGDGRLLGAKWCYNRPARIVSLATGDVEPFSFDQSIQEGRSNRSPRVYTDANGTSTLFWLSNDLGGAHASCTSLHSVELGSSTAAASTILDKIWDPAKAEFPGFYPDFVLPTKPFVNLDSGLHVVTQSTWGSRSTVLLISASTGAVKNLTPDSDGKAYSWAVLSADGDDQVICTRSSPSIPPEVVLGRLSKSGEVSWRVIFKPSLSEPIAQALTTLQGSIVPIPDRHPTETIVLRSVSGSPTSTVPPCITMPHGGPHMTTTTAFNAVAAALALQGYTISSPNYTGSLGFGERYIRKLLGACGTLDVQDCIASVQHLIKLGISEAGPGKQFIQGGSHGGFLAGHLIGQYPDIFAAAVIRNPVISCGEISTSDIHDWYYAESGLPFDQKTLMTPETYATLYAASPIAHVDAVRARVLLLIGEVDQRVAPTQGINYYHALKGRGKPVEMLCFPGDSHTLDSVEAAFIGWRASFDWFEAVRG